MVQILPRWNIDLRPVWKYLKDEVVITAVLFRAPFYLAAAVGAASASYAWILVLTQFAVNVLAKYRANFKKMRVTPEGRAETKSLSPQKAPGRDRRSRAMSMSMAGHVHKVRKPSYVRVPGMADPKGDSGESLSNDAAMIASLRVTVISAHDLIVKSRGNKDPNPYCKLFVIQGGEKSKRVHETAKCRKTKTPQWSEDREQKVFEKINIKDAKLCVQLWDHHTVFKDKLVGEVSVPVTKIQHGSNEATFELKQAGTESANSLTLGVLTLRTHLALQDEDLALLQEQSRSDARSASAGDGNEESVFAKDPPAEEPSEEAAQAEDAGAGVVEPQPGGTSSGEAAAVPDDDSQPPQSRSRLFAAGLQRAALKVTDLYVHAIGGLTLAFLFGLYGIDVFLLAVVVEVLIVLERRLPSLHEAIEDDDAQFGRARARSSWDDNEFAGSKPEGGGGAGDGPYQPFLAELFSRLRGDAASGLIDVDAEWLTGALALAWELYTPWADKFVGKLIRDPLTPLGLELEYFTVGQLPLVCKSIKGVPHTRPGNYFDLVMQVEWAADLYIQIGWKGIPLVVVEGLYLSAGVKAAMKMLELEPDDAPNIFPNIDGLRLDLAQRPELDLQLKLFGVLDLFSLMLLAYLKEVALDYVFETFKQLWFFNTESQRTEQLQWIEDNRAGNTLLGPFGERFVDPPRPLTPSVFKGQRFRLVVNCVIGWDLAVKDRTFCKLRFGRGTARGKHDMIEKQTRAHAEHDNAGCTFWQEQFSWLTREDRDKLEVEIFDHNQVRDHKSFGSWKEEFGILRRSMNLVPDAEPTFKPIDLFGKGKVHLMVQLQTLWDDPLRKDEAAAEAAALGSPRATTEELRLAKSVWKNQTGTLLVNLIKADSLPSKDGSGRSRSQVTVKFFLVNQALLRNRSSLDDEWFVTQSPPCYNTLSPRWANVPLENVFHIEVDRPAGTTLLVAQVWDGSDFIGAEAIRLGDLVGSAGSRVFMSATRDVKRQLYNNNDVEISGERLSTLHMDLEFTPDPVEALPDVQLPHEPTAVPGPYIRVEILKAFNLKKMDMLGKSDPFAELEVYDVPQSGDPVADELAKTRSMIRHRTHTIDNTLNPVWSNKPGGCVYYLYLSRAHDQELRVLVKDEDQFGPSTLIGEWTESVRRLYFIRDNTLKPLEDPVGGPAGMLELSIKFLGDWSHLSPPASAPASVE